MIQIIIIALSFFLGLSPSRLRADESRPLLKALDLIHEQSAKPFTGSFYVNGKLQYRFFGQRTKKSFKIEFIGPDKVVFESSEKGDNFLIKRGSSKSYETVTKSIGLQALQWIVSGAYMGPLPSLIPSVFNDRLRWQDNVETISATFSSNFLTNAQVRILHVKASQSILSMSFRSSEGSSYLLLMD